MQKDRKKIIREDGKVYEQLADGKVGSAQCLSCWKEYGKLHPLTQSRTSGEAVIIRCPSCETVVGGWRKFILY